MFWKRETHKKNKTNLIETYSWENKNQELLTNLSEKLKKWDVKLDNQIKYKSSKLMGEFIDLIERIVTIIKIKSIDIEELRKKIKYIYKYDKSIGSIKNNDLIELVYKVYNEYEKQLKINHEIDYSDMIKKQRNI